MQRFEQLCPNCCKIMYVFKHSGYQFMSKEYIGSCDHCGYGYQLFKVRDKADIANDRGIYKFTTIYNIYGAVIINLQNGNNITLNVDSKYIDTLIGDLTLNKEIINSAYLSYLDKSLNKIVKVELMQFL